ncbi:hypothetical protein RI367_006762 [Sorochytrium milnesiophthora]
MLPWNYNPPVLATLVISQIVAIALFVVNVKAARRQRTLLAAIQLLAATMHLILQAWFLYQHLGRNLPCHITSIIGGTINRLFQLATVHVIIDRSTCLLREGRRLAVRIGLYGMLLASSVAIDVSNVLRTWIPALLAQGVCSSTLNRPWNVAGKACLIILYVWILAIFLIPLLQHLQALQAMQAMRLPSFSASSKGRPTSQGRMVSPERLQEVVQALFLKIVLTIVTLLVTCILDAFDMFGNYGYIEFSLQHTVMLYASTLSMSSFSPTQPKTAAYDVTTALADGRSPQPPSYAPAPTWQLPAIQRAYALDESDGDESSVDLGDGRWA